MKFRNLALSPRQVVDDIALCLVFFTRLPLPVFDFRGRSLAAAIWAAPIAGLVVGLIGAIVFATAERFGLAMGPAAALALVATVLTTGCLHEDGLSDVSDGFGGGKSRGRKLEIMRDSRIGTYGAAALGLSLLIRWSALSEFVDPTQALFALIAAHAASRGLLGAFMHLLPSARVDGLSADAGTVSQETAIAGAVLGAIPLLLLGLGGAIFALILLGLLFAAFRALCLNQIDGQTGDTIGALQQASEIAVLLVASVALS
ncbi:MULTISPECIES: adenosylcobinamide-GDP ribazoletransferase [unclassified Mesorhizobium]|uniref:adenosylcobinamide-GDP ribazoletransferase n=1 Tax=unclassified Mesorhizobium TaxID=325217 RepID=UPI000FCAD612|nr:MULTISPECIES: adenosylcobinamide-GDP ribazoletransferase [unclassified Mesorhizobium]AZV21416.1 adenosylcobinamide-GDP ribazoletransferase [Mesorhizobium sp. M7A.F.Ce.TU.012.03.2.1]RUU86240.1 adenosylcobinamide-GDP ribazoletransferase [Mesorhizobium sp. M7A.F.Ca.MR.176.00.0.0]RVD49258.1 adenosylcobinamide-GDP ribazoletransferase [Mesorhizobium sp. M7A.F.Ca.ET.027.03.2.1]RWO79650.1 MAG: adenosylcobinamide-GDP ribazoletransferase [Mesorhizobium sp.]RWP89087.1 MAG: adenosylcobinamide-GDP ribaz